jgi:hypothetical protein
VPTSCCGKTGNGEGAEPSSFSMSRTGLNSDRRNFFSPCTAASWTEHTPVFRGHAYTSWNHATSFRVANWEYKCRRGWSLHKDTTPPQPNHTVTPTHIEPEHYNTRNKSTISRKLLKMDALTFETCWAVNGEIIKRVTSSWSIFIQLSRWCAVN